MAASSWPDNSASNFPEVSSFVTRSARSVARYAGWLSATYFHPAESRVLCSDAAYGGGKRSQFTY